MKKYNNNQIRVKKNENEKIVRHNNNNINGKFYVIKWKINFNINDYFKWVIKFIFFHKNVNKNKLMVNNI